MTPENQAPGLGQGTTEGCGGVPGRGCRQGRHRGYCPRVALPDLREPLPHSSSSAARRSSTGLCSRPAACWAAGPAPRARGLCPRTRHGARGRGRACPSKAEQRSLPGLPANPPPGSSWKGVLEGPQRARAEGWLGAERQEEGSRPDTGLLGEGGLIAPGPSTFPTPLSHMTPSTELIPEARPRTRHAAPSSSRAVPAEATGLASPDQSTVCAGHLSRGTGATLCHHRPSAPRERGREQDGLLHGPPTAPTPRYHQPAAAGPAGDRRRPLPATLALGQGETVTLWRTHRGR